MLQTKSSLWRKCAPSMMPCVGIERGMQFWSSWCTICRLQAEMVVGQLSWLREEDESLSLSPPLNSWCIIVLEKLTRITLLYVSLPSLGLPSLPTFYWSFRPPSIPWGWVPTLHAKEMPLLPKISLCTWGRTSLRRQQCSMRYTYFHRRINSIGLFFNEKVSIQDLFGEVPYQISILPWILSTLGSFLDHLSPLGIHQVDKSMHQFKKN